MATTKNDLAADAAADTSGAANVTPASDFSPSGAPRQLTDIDVDHPAVDNNPRAGTTVDQNRIDFNDPSLSGADVVAKALGMKTEAEAAKSSASGSAKDQGKS